MFALRGLAVSLSIFILCYGALSGAVCGLWRRVLLFGRRRSPGSCVGLLFALRLAPFVIAAAITFFIFVPSFVLLEPRFAKEAMGSGAAVLGLCGMVAIAAGIWNAATAWLRASQTIARWSSAASPLDSRRIRSASSVSVIHNSVAAPPLTAAGVLRPSVWLSSAANSLLTEDELQAALRHEFAHVNRRDNLRKLIFRLVAFPGMAGLQYAWREAAEMAADDAAVSSVSEALDLAAAVIKLSRMAPLQPPAEMTTALVHGPAESVDTRVQRLIAWQDRPEPVQMLSWKCSALAAAVATGTLFLTYSELMVRAHAATEWLMK
jgi:beta-lactamase regulating signal transducer with metallopeptidase domain